jgi:AraC-like DNA-binding protein/tetratricopeptide (TPR) repeat protein
MFVPGDVKKAIELLRAQPERRLSIGKLAASCGVAPRTLQKHFKQFVGKTPAELRFEARMDRARRELLRAKPNISVADVAASCGIRHLGRFSTLYRERFGENPSATLRRRGHRDGTQNGITVLPVNLDRPVIAIHKFTCQEQPCAPSDFDLSQEIGVGLMRERWFRVGSVDRAAYHLKGDVRYDSSLLRITVTLTSAETGHCLWADRWQGSLGSILAFQDRVVARVTNAVRRALFDAEITRSIAKDSKNTSGWELTMKALPLAMRIEEAPLSRALDLLEQAMELSPTDGLPVALAAWCRAQRGSHHLSERPEVEKLSGLELVARGAELTNDDAIVQSLFGSACALAGKFDQAASHIDRALALNGASAWAWNRLGMLDVYRGNFSDATECFQIARDLDPSNPLNFMSSIGIGSAHFDAGRYGEGAVWFGRAIAEHPAAVWINRFRAPALLLAGKKGEAGKAFVELTRKYPDLTVKTLRQAIPYRQNHWDRLAEGLVDLGMPL